MRVSVIISNYNDTAMLTLTALSALEALVPVPGGGEVIITDSSDPQIAEPLFAGSFIAKKYFDEGSVRLINAGDVSLFRSRELAAREAKGQYIFCLDSHMLVGYNTIKDLVDFMNNRRYDMELGFAHSPICWTHQHISTAKQGRILNNSELGEWMPASGRLEYTTWKGMPWMCRRRWFLNKLMGYGSLSRHDLKWGGGDMHIGTKAWLLGYRNWAVPTRPCYHIGPFPKHVVHHHRYRLYQVSRGRGMTGEGFLISCYVLGGEEMMKRNAELVHERFKTPIKGEFWDRAIEKGKAEREWLLAHQKISYDEWLKTEPWNEEPAPAPLPPTRSREEILKDHAIEMAVAFGADRPPEPEAAGEDIADLL